MQTIKVTPTRTWYDLGWTMPLLGATLWAAKWQPSPVTPGPRRVRQKRFGELLLDNATLALAPLIVLLQVAQLGTEWHAVRFTLLGVSIVCYAVRLGVTQYRQNQTEDTLQRHNRAMDSAVNGIAIVDVKGQHTYANAAFAQMVGHENVESIVGRPWKDVYAPQDVERVEGEIRESMRKRGKWYGPMTIHRRDGSALPVEMAVKLMPDGGVGAIIVDITERKQLETQLQQARRMEAIGRLAGGIAHDFNNLLTIIKGYTELALNRPRISAELQADVERIEDASERAGTLVRQLLAFSRRQVLQPKLIDLNGIVLGLDKLLRRLMDEDIQMTTIPGKDVGTIKADPGQMEQVIMNLVVNARDAMPNGGRLTVETANVDLDAAYASDHATVKPGSYGVVAGFG